MNILKKTVMLYLIFLTISCASEPETKQVMEDPISQKAFIINYIENELGPMTELIPNANEEYEIDICYFAPSKKYPYQVFITVGLSDYLQPYPNNGIEEYCELMVSLPPDWNIDDNDWPLRMLLKTATFPLITQTPLMTGFAVSSGKKNEAYSESTIFSGAYIKSPDIEDLEYLRYNNKHIFIYSLFPLYPQELDDFYDMGLLWTFSVSGFEFNDIIDIHRAPISFKK